MTYQIVKHGIMSTGEIALMKKEKHYLLSKQSKPFYKNFNSSWGTSINDFPQKTLQQLTFFNNDYQTNYMDNIKFKQK